MYGWSKLNKNESGQAALEAAIILIAFVVVASVFAFAILSAGTASTEKGEAAIYAGLEGVQSSMQLKGAVYANTDGTNVESITFTVSLVAGGEPVNMDPAATNNATIISYRDADLADSQVTYTVDVVTGDADLLLEDGELFEITADVGDDGGSPAVPADVVVNTPFTFEIKPPTGGVLQINRTTPASLDTITELR